MHSEFNKRSPVRNGVLSNLSVQAFSLMRPFLQTVHLDERTVLLEPQRRIDHVTFIETGMVSLRTLAKGCMLETAMVGRRGVVGASLALGVDSSIHQSIVLVSGTALRIRADDLLRLMAECPQIREQLLRYVQALMIHSSQTALCGVHHDLEPRLASWLCIACDSLQDDVLPMTHEHLSIVLGLHRPGLTRSLIRLEEQELIRKTRGHIQIRKRQSLQEKACSCYATITHAYESSNHPNDIFGRVTTAHLGPDEARPHLVDS